MIARNARTAWCIVALLLHAAPAAAQFGCPAVRERLSLGPAYLDEIDGNRALGATGTATWCRADYDVRLKRPRALYVGLQADGAVPFARVSLPQNLRGSAWLGLAVALTERRLDTGRGLDEEEPGLRYNHGVLGVGGRVQYESGTDFDEQALAGGVEVRWANPIWRLAPSVVLAISAVRPLASEVRDTLDVGREVHGRIGVQMYWLTPIGGPFTVELDGRAFAGFGMDELIAEAGLDQGAFVAGNAGWVLGRNVGPVRLERFYVGYSHGRQPTDARERRAWTVGARLTPPGEEQVAASARNR